MNAKQVFVTTVAIAAASFCGIVGAQQNSRNQSSGTEAQPVRVEKSRDEVRAELRQAMKDGSFTLSSYAYVERAHPETPRAETLAARARVESPDTRPLP